jgi:cob(I)alamin adenosyltransferase
MDETEAAGRHAWSAASGMLASGDHDLLIFDEITYIMSFGWVPVDEVVGAIAARAPHTNVVCTGRDAPAALIDLADTVTEMVPVKHAFDQGMRTEGSATAPKSGHAP